MKLAVLFCVLCFAVASSAQSRFQTFTAIPTVFADGAFRGTNVVTLRADEAVKVCTARPLANSPNALAEKIYLQIGDQVYSVHEGDIFRGPASFVMNAASTSSNNWSGTLITLEFLPGQTPPDRTLVIAPGTNLVAVALECSTNLVHWTTATNGLYGSPDAAKFFRIHAER